MAICIIYEPAPRGLYTAYDSNTGKHPNNNPSYNMAMDIGDVKPDMFGRGKIYPARCIILKRRTIDG